MQVAGWQIPDTGSILRSVIVGLKSLNVNRLLHKPNDRTGTKQTIDNKPDIHSLTHSFI